jgi:hypothetical protein
MIWIYVAATRRRGALDGLVQMLWVQDLQVKGLWHGVIGQGVHVFLWWLWTLRRPSPDDMFTTLALAETRYG